MPKIRSRKTSNLIPAGEPQFYSVAGLADKLGRHRRTVHSWIIKGRIKAIAVGDVFAMPAKEARRIKEEIETRKKKAAGCGTGGFGLFNTAMSARRTWNFTCIP